MEIAISERNKDDNERMQKKGFSSVIFSKKNIVSIVLLVVKLATIFVKKNKSE